MRGMADPAPLRVKVARDGLFDFSNVPPGNYRAAVRAVSRTTPVVPITVLDKDITGLELAVTRPIKVQGRVIVEGGGSIPDFRFRMEQNAFGLVSGPVRLNSDGTFSLELPEKIRFELYGYPSSFDLKSVTYGANNLLREPLKAGGAEMQITFSRRP